MSSKTLVNATLFAKKSKKISLTAQNEVYNSYRGAKV